MGMKKSHDKLKDGLPPLKKFEGDGELPYVFDLLWDLHTPNDIRYQKELITYKPFLNFLAENGYDVKEFLNRMDNEDELGD